MNDVKAIPDGHRAVTPHLVVRNAAEAIEFYKRAFGAEELRRSVTPGGRFVMHAEIRIGDSIIMLGDEMPQMQGLVSPQQLSGTTVAIHLWTENPDALFERALKAGARIVFPLTDAFWGDRYGRVADPFGHEWSIAAHIRDLSTVEIHDAAIEFFSKIAPQKPPAKPAARKPRKPQPRARKSAAPARKPTNGKPSKKPRAALRPAAKKILANKPTKTKAAKRKSGVTKKR